MGQDGVGKAEAAAGAIPTRMCQIRSEAPSKLQKRIEIPRRPLPPQFSRGASCVSANFKRGAGVSAMSVVVAKKSR